MSEWKEYRFKEFAIFSQGIQVDINDQMNQPFHNSVRFIRIVDFTKGTENEIRFIANPGLRYLVQSDDLVMIRYGSQTAGKIARGFNGAIANNTFKITLREDIANKDFIFHYLSQKSVFNFFHNSQASSTMPAITFDMIGNLEIELPPLHEQTAIAEVLSSLDDKIDLLHRQNKTLEQLPETLFRQWFVEVAEGSWQSGKLGDILSLIESGSRPKGGIDPELKFGIPSIGAENINGIGVYDFSKTKFITHEYYRSMRRGIINDYDVLIYKDGAYIGRKGMFGKNFPYQMATVNEHVFILRSNERANQFFLYFLLKQDELEQLNANSAQPGLNQEAMKSLEITIPPIDLIKRFGEFTKPFIDKIFFNSNQIKTLTQLRDILLPKLMSGEVKVQ